MSWDDAMEIWAELVGKDEGFYLSHQVRNDKKTAVLAVQHTTRKKDSTHKKDKLYRIYRPNTGLQVKMESKADLLKKYSKVRWGRISLSPSHASLLVEVRISNDIYTTVGSAVEYFGPA